MANSINFKRKLIREVNDKINKTFQRNQHVTPDLISRLGLEKELEGHQGCVNCLEWNEKGTLLASGSDDVQIILWDPFSHKQLSSLRTGHQGNIFAVKFLPNSNDVILVSGAADSKIRVHDLNMKDTTHVYSCHAGRVKRIATAPTIPFMFWSAAEDGTIMQFDLRCTDTSQTNPQNILINLNAHMGEYAEAKCLSINPLQPELMAVGANDPYVRVYDRRMLTCRRMQYPGEASNRFPWDHPHLDAVSGEDYSLPVGCVDYYVAGHLPKKQSDYIRYKRYRSLASTYVTFSPTGSELLVNLGGEQIYLFDINRKRNPQKYDISLIKSANGVVREATCPPTNGFSIHRTDANGVTNGVKPLMSMPSTSASFPQPVEFEIDDPEKTEKPRPYRKHKSDVKLAPSVEYLKKRANNYFEKDEFTKAIMMYNQAISRAPLSSVLFSNRAAAYMKRKWDGDLYAALRDCHCALNVDPNHLKAHFRLARCLYELSWAPEAFECLQQFKIKFPDYAKSHACVTLDRDIKAAIFSKTDTVEKEGGSGDTHEKQRSVVVSEQEKYWTSQAYDYESRFCGHCNTTTDIKEANFFGSNGQYIVAGSDDGSFFVWEKETTNIVRVLRGDDSIVNCLQPHPSSCLLATSGIDPVVRLWSPRPEDGSKNEREIDNSDDAASANQKRMNADPLEIMLMNMGYRITGFLDVDEEDSERSEQPVNCHQS
ncbi:hypothetical protein SNE40_018646 [Patella caerulea]|uniref:WD and tetratricopeptide repeats protein 1 n=1 Tax=Patella caerulea TaxID=87958 RepID=A0AAN8J7S9_PATCE